MRKSNINKSSKFYFFILLFLSFCFPLKAQLKFSNPELKEYDSWISLKNTNIYAKADFKTKIGNLNKNERFKIIDSYYLMYDYMIAKITKINKNNFDECKSQGFKLGDEIKLITGLGESQWAIVHNGKIKYASFDFDYDNDRLTSPTYDGCNVINANIIKSTEKRYFIVKIKTNKGKIGYIRFISDGNHKNEFLEFIQSY